MERLGYYESELLCAGASEFRANRLSYVGELGYELYVPSQDAQTLWQRLWQAGAPLSIRAAGFHAMNACRMKGYRHRGDDIRHITLARHLGSPHQQSRLSGAAGQRSARHQRKRLVSLAIEGDDAPFMLHDEPITETALPGGLTTSAHGATG